MMSAPNENELAYHQAVQMAGLIYKIAEKQPLTAEEQQQLNEWLSSNDANAGLLESLQDHKQVADELEVLMRYDEEKAVAAIFNAVGSQPPVTGRLRTMKTGWFTVAASLLLMAGVATWFLLKQNRARQTTATNTTAVPGSRNVMLTLSNGRQVILDPSQAPYTEIQGGARLEKQQGRLVYTAINNGPVVYNTITTPKGVQYAVQLADGSEVWLNAASSLTYPTSFMGNKRELTLTGEGYFSVAPDKTRPFFVTANTMKVQVVGTEFNIMAYNDEDYIRTTLVHGIVKAGNSGKQELILQPGEQATLVRQSGQMHIEKALIDDVTAWRYDQFRFQETAIPAIMRQITRWYDVKVEYRQGVDNIRLTGQITKKDSIKELLDILSDTRKVHFEIKSDKTIMVIPGHK